MHSRGDDRFAVATPSRPACKAGSGRAGARRADHGSARRRPLRGASAGTAVGGRPAEWRSAARLTAVGPLPSSQACRRTRGMRMRRPTRRLGNDPSRTACCTSQRLMPSSSAVSATLRVGRSAKRHVCSCEVVRPRSGRSATAVRDRTGGTEPLSATPEAGVGEPVAAGGPVGQGRLEPQAARDRSGRAAPCRSCQHGQAPARDCPRRRPARDLSRASHGSGRRPWSADPETPRPSPRRRGDARVAPAAGRRWHRCAWLALSATTLARSLAQTFRSGRCHPCPRRFPLARVGSTLARACRRRAPRACEHRPGGCGVCRTGAATTEGSLSAGRRRGSRRRRSGRRAGRRVGPRSAGAGRWSGLRCRCRR